MMKRVLVIGLQINFVCCLLFKAQAEDSLSITQKESGKSILVEVLDADDQEVTVRLATGKKHSIALSSLTVESVEKVKLLLVNRKVVSSEEYLVVNELISQPVFSEEYLLWGEPVSKVGRRLQLRQESTVAEMLSYRLYTRKDEVFLGAHPYCITLYGDREGNVEQLSLVFANKGDYGSLFGSGEDHFKKIHPNQKMPNSLEEAIELDVATITKKLNVQFGEAKVQYFGEKSDRRKVKRWDWRDHAFVLSELKDEYVSLVIMPLAVADAQGKVARVNDSEMKKVKAKNVLRKDNGDVRITNIPMVDQGPKGYCAPATLERAMRYMGVPADMYLLAVSATDPERGTNTRLLKENCKRIVRSKARSFKDVDIGKKMKMKDIKKHIDKGVPILWSMKSLSKYNDLVNKRTKERVKVTDFDVWSAEIEEEKEKMLPALAVEDNYHICMIIGYNEQTQELAVSDSWGKRYELRWVHIDIAAAVSYGNSFVLSF